MKRKCLSLSLCLSLCLSLAAPALAAEKPVFSDVPAGSWFEKGAATYAQRGIMVGTGEGLFSPDTELTAAECLTLALRLYDLQQGGDGTLEAAPEDWGRMTLTLNDGTVFTRYGEQNFFFDYTRFDNAAPDGSDLYAIYVQAHGESVQEREAYAKAHEGNATFMAEGKDYPGTVVSGSTYDGPCLRFSFLPPQEEPSDLFFLFRSARPGPERWYRNAAYTCEIRGLTEADGFDSLLGYLSNSGPDVSVRRESFAKALAVAAGTLEKKYELSRIPDVERHEGSEGIYMLYEAGVLGGVDPFGTFDGNDFLTRAEAAVMTARVLDPDQRLSSPPSPPDAYDQAVIDLRSGSTYSRQSERTYETEDCTIFVYDRGGAMHTGPGNITIIYKPGSQPGAGTVLSAETPNTWATLQTGVDMLQLSEDRKTLTYGYLIEDEMYDLAVHVSGPAGFYTYTVDLPTGVTTPSYAPLSYESSLSTLSYGRNYTLEKQLEGAACTLLLRWKPLTAREPDVKDYELWLVRRDETGSRTRLLLPSTAISEDHHYAPTDRAPDSLEISEDGRTLTYTYRFDQALEDYHDAGTYTYMVDLTTGELTVEHAPL